MLGLAMALPTTLASVVYARRLVIVAQWRLPRPFSRSDPMRHGIRIDCCSLPPDGPVRCYLNSYFPSFSSLRSYGSTLDPMTHDIL